MADLTLKEQLEMASHNLLCYSSNYLMSEPKLGFVKEYLEALQEVERLKRLILQQDQEEKA